MGESSIIHLGLIKSRVTGAGSCALQLSTFDNSNPISLVKLPLSATTGRIAQRLANYNAQGIMLRGSAIEIDDTIRVQDITLFLKTIYTEYPM